MQNQLMPGSPKAISKATAAGLFNKYQKEHPEEFNAWERFLGDISASGFVHWSEKGGKMSYLFEDNIFPTIIYSPATIFANKIPALDVNFINPSVLYAGGEGEITMSLLSGKSLGDYGSVGEIPVEDIVIQYRYILNETPEDEDEAFKGNTAYQLRDIIATWYKTIRNIGIVALLSILIYVAIRIILSSVAGEKAKYKTMLKDWLMGLCILFVLHYGMAFLFRATEMITNMFEEVCMINIDSNSDGSEEHALLGDIFMNEARLQAEDFLSPEGNEVDSDEKTLSEFGYTVVYAMLVVYTIIFTWKYIKRFVYLAFLTIISPFIAITYPIDKMKDGSAQAFNMWMKEYVYNVLIQPVHLILYSILITSAENFAADNIIYTIVILGFLLEAEKIVKTLFGFNKATGGEFSSALTGGMLFGAAANTTQKIFGKLPAGDKNKKGEENDKSKIRMNRKADLDKKSIDLGNTFGGSSRTSNPLTSPLTQKQIPRKTPKSRGSSRTSNPLTLPLMQNQTPRKTIKLGSGVGKGRYTSKYGRGINNLVGKVGEKYDNSEFGKSKFGKKIKGVTKGVTNVAKYTGKKIFNKENGKYVIKKGMELVGAGVGAATFATLGAIGGLTSGESGDALKYAALGLGIGASGGKRVGGAVGKGVVGAGEEMFNPSNPIREQYEIGAYGKDEAQARANARADKKWRESSETKRYYKDKYGDDWEDAMANAEELRSRGIVDQGEIDQAIKMTERNPGLNHDQAAAIMKVQRGLTAQQMRDNWDNIFSSILNQTRDSGTANMIMNEMNENLKE